MRPTLLTSPCRGIRGTDWVWAGEVVERREAMLSWPEIGMSLPFGEIDEHKEVPDGAVAALAKSGSAS